MADTTTMRQCGNCGEAVDAADITCPHCDALLAAYEPPAGATSGTTAAAMPVEIITPPVADPLPDPPPVAKPADPSPIATAIEETKAAAEAVEERRADTIRTSPSPAAERLANAVDLTDLPAQAAAGIPTPTPSTTPSPVRETLTETRAKVEAPTDPAARTTPARATVPVERPRPVRPSTDPEWVRQQQVDDASDSPNRPTHRSSSSGAIWVIVIGLFILMRSTGGMPLLTPLLTIGGIFLIIWFITRMAHATGRKTTTMPWDDQRRRRR